MDDKIAVQSNHLMEHMDKAYLINTNRSPTKLLFNTTLQAERNMTFSPANMNKTQTSYRDEPSEEKFMSYSQRGGGAGDNSTI